MSGVPGLESGLKSGLTGCALLPQALAGGGWLSLALTC